MSDSNYRIVRAVEIAFEVGHQPGTWQRLDFPANEVMATRCLNCMELLMVRLGDTHGRGKYRIRTACDIAIPPTQHTMYPGMVL